MFRLLYFSANLFCTMFSHRNLSPVRALLSPLFLSQSLQTSTTHIHTTKLLKPTFIILLIIQSFQLYPFSQEIQPRIIWKTKNWIIINLKRGIIYLRSQLRKESHKPILKKVEMFEKINIRGKKLKGETPYGNLFFFFFFRKSKVADRKEKETREEEPYGSEIHGKKRTGNFADWMRIFTYNPSPILILLLRIFRLKMRYRESLLPDYTSFGRGCVRGELLLFFIIIIF